MNKTPLSLIPEYRDYVWGGSKLRPEVVPTAEAWIVYANNRVASGIYAGHILAELAEDFGEALLGSRAVALTGKRFPLLIKILDAAQWLSLQVHPNDAQAKKLEGENFFGKTEAWHILENEPNAKLIAGMKKNITAEALADSIKNGTILETVEQVEVKAGDTLFMKPGTIHALGPGLLIYEVQQTSDITYRVYDWGRPQTETRKLHIEKALAVSNPAMISAVVPAPYMNDGDVKTLTQCEYFKLDTILVEKKTLEMKTLGESFHALTMLDGESQISVDGEAFVIKKFETVLIPASCGIYQIQPLGKARILKASV